ncbi:hypothetical protein GGR51DRAFT_572760 [Nemania sp. FL0031]|nr:hypothetical protein GGR51DRAFT_572760 [Nemania sp. FL0031]
MSHVTMGEQHTPSRSLDNTGVLMFRDFNDDPELFVRYRLDDPYQTYSIPNLVPYLDETALETALRVGRLCLGIHIPEHLLDYNQSVVIDSPGTSVRVRVFIVRAPRGITSIPNFEGWRYEFVPLASIDHLYVHPEVRAGRLALEQILRTR